MFCCSSVKTQQLYPQATQYCSSYGMKKYRNLKKRIFRLMACTHQRQCFITLHPVHPCLWPVINVNILMSQSSNPQTSKGHRQYQQMGCVTTCVICNRWCLHASAAFCSQCHIWCMNKADIKQGFVFGFFLKMSGGYAQHIVGHLE